MILGKFLDERYPSLNDAQAQAFAEIADFEDPELWDLINGRSTCVNSAHVEIIDMLSKS